MRRFDKTTWLPVALALYLTGSYVYLYIDDKLHPSWSTAGLVALSYVLVVVLWAVNRRRRRGPQKSENQ